MLSRIPPSPYRRFLAAALIVIAVACGARMCNSSYAQPVAGHDVQIAAIADTAALPWLHVEVETSYGWLWQKSTGRAYVTAGRKNAERVKVGKLCIQLVAHDTTRFCLEQADSITVFERKRGLGISKREAVVTAWTFAPSLEPTTVSLKP